MSRQAFSSGARGYVVKSSIAKDLLTAIEKVGRHEPFLDPALSSAANRGSHVDAQEVVQRSIALEQALRESEEMYRATFEQAAVGMCHVSTDGVFLRVNSKLCDLLGYSQEEFLKLTFMDITHPEDLRSDVDNAAALLAGSLGSYQIEKRYQKKDGSTVWGQLTVGLLCDRFGKPRHFISVVAEIGERKRAEEALRASEKQFRILADSIPQLAWMAHGDGSIFWYNQRWYEYTGTNLEQMHGWNWQSVHHPDHVHRVVERFKQAIASGEPWEDTFPLRGTDGKYRTFLSRALPLRDHRDQVTKWFGTNTDVGEHVEIEKV